MFAVSAIHFSSSSSRFFGTSADNFVRTFGDEREEHQFLVKQIWDAAAFRNETKSQINFEDETLCYQ